MIVLYLWTRAIPSPTPSAFQSRHNPGSYNRPRYSRGPSPKSLRRSVNETEPGILSITQQKRTRATGSAQKFIVSKGKSFLLLQPSSYHALLPYASSSPAPATASMSTSLPAAPYHGKTPSRFVKVPFSPSSPKVASLHALIAPSLGAPPIFPISGARFVFRSPG